MTGETSQVMDTARQWMLRVNEPDFSGWDAFSQWLEARGEHLAAYEAALQEDAWLEQLPAMRAQAMASTEAQAAMPAPDNVRQLRPARRWLAIATGAVAASLAAIIAFSGMLTLSDTTSIATGPGVRQSVTLADNSRIDVNGASRISYDPERPRIVTLVDGEALFDVKHDDADPFTVVVDKTELVDVGTVFNVVSDAGRLDVAVAEGVVLYRHEGREIRLEAGDRLLRDNVSGAVTLVRADPDMIGAWRRGILSYRNASLDMIASDLSRRLRKPVRVSASASAIRYSGTLSVAGDDDQMLTAAAALLGVRIRETSDAWEMTRGDVPAS